MSGEESERICARELNKDSIYILIIKMYIHKRTWLQMDVAKIE